ncbi:unnamed protein product [Caenorhabditis auriculariae]|uniref:DUF7808 domain-containing protein n=1 Tax=Caenorhabditis auriculariae TaxID=2777116 RepID=A0A8S1HQJ2_9PELO|nr:unnamed protein product [Caenorhabditis auriculariae]
MRLFILIALTAKVAALFDWERRILSCTQEVCFLYVNEEPPHLANCTRSDERVSCDMECDGAERDSVISKNPTIHRKCTRFYTYNMERIRGTERWALWRSSFCAKSNITFTVHCAFPVHFH